MAKNRDFLIAVPVGEGGGAKTKAKKSPYSSKSLGLTNHIYATGSPDYQQNPELYTTLWTKEHLVQEELVWYQQKTGYRQTRRTEMYWWKKGFPNVHSGVNASGPALDSINDLKA